MFTKISKSGDRGKSNFKLYSFPSYFINRMEFRGEGGVGILLAICYPQPCDISGNLARSRQANTMNFPIKANLCRPANICM